MNGKTTLGAVCLLAMLLLPLGPLGALAAAQGKNGTLTGFIGDQRSGDLIRKAGVEIVGADKTVYTGVDGDYTVSLPPGTYTIRFFFQGYISQSVESVTIVSGETTQVDAVLVPEGYGEVVDVVATGNDSIAAIEERKTATTIAEVISKEEISNDTSSTASGVLARVTGITVVNDVVFVRGLGDRYSNTVVNDAIVPNTDPERKVVSMDLIPSNLISGIRILKSFTPDQPGEFSGGLVRIDTVELPHSASLNFSYSMGFNSETTGEDILDYPGDNHDWFGFGLGRRRLPSVIPTTDRVLRGNIFIPGGFNPQELQVFGRSFEQIWTPERTNGAPDSSFNLSGGNAWGKFGFIGAVGLKNERQRLLEKRKFYLLDQGNLVPGSDYDYESATTTARLASTANFTYEIDGNNKLFFKNFFTNQATDEARQFQGYYVDRASTLRNTRLRYIVERIYTGQLSGNHLVSFGNLIFNWRYTYSQSSLDEPDLREALYEQNPFTKKFSYFDQDQSLFRLFSEMRENLREPAFDLSRFWFRNKFTVNVKVGGSYINRDRTFDSRRFRFVPRSLFGIDPTQTPEQLLASENIDPDRGFEIRETTRATDHFDALNNITAGYAMGDVTFGKWRFIGGARVERAIFRVNTFEPFKDSVPVISAELDDTDWLPSIAGVYAVTSTMNIRAGYSRTIARPQFRELSPFEFTDVTGGRSKVGNPNIQRTRIDNFDARYEWFPTPSELISVGYFYKRLDDPIETVVRPGPLLVTSFTNADEARNQGLEFEMRKNLGFIAKRLENVSLSANYSYVDSTVTLSPQDLDVITTRERPLVGQSRHSFNLTLVHAIPSWNFETRALYNYTGERITDVGSFGLPDIVQHGYPTLDLRFSKDFGGERKPFSVSVELENLLNRLNDTRQGNQLFRAYRTGRDISVGVSYRFF